MKRLVLSILTIAVLALSACSGTPFARPSSASPSPSPSVAANVDSGIACADVIAKALTSASKVVPGSYECLDANARDEFARGNPSVGSDADFPIFDTKQAAGIGQPVLAVYQFYEFTTDAQGQVTVVYRVSDAAGAYECLGVFMAGTNTAISASSARDQAQGKLVDGVQFISGSSGLC